MNTHCAHIECFLRACVCACVRVQCIWCTRVALSQDHHHTKDNMNFIQYVHYEFSSTLQLLRGFAGSRVRGFASSQQNSAAKSVTKARTNNSYVNPHTYTHTHTDTVPFSNKRAENCTHAYFTRACSQIIRPFTRRERSRHRKRRKSATMHNRLKVRT